MWAQISPPADALAPLRQAAEKSAADWEKLARGLEAKIGRMLPCDPRARAAIEEVSRASESRLQAMAQYLKAAIAMAKGDTEAAKAAVSGQNTGSKDLETERAEAAQEKVAIDGQLADLTDSARKLPPLDASEKKLQEIAAMVRDRAAEADRLADVKDPLAVPLQNVLAAYQARESALEDEQVALALEASRWSEYYAARLARAQTECSIINGRRQP